MAGPDLRHEGAVGDRIAAKRRLISHLSEVSVGVFSKSGGMEAALSLAPHDPQKLGSASSSFAQCSLSFGYPASTEASAS